VQKQFITQSYACTLTGYGPFGESTQVEISNKTPAVVYGFVGGEYDLESHRYYFRARLYDPSTGRWTTRDPIGFGGGDANLYGYVANDPVSFIDPSGQSWKDVKWRNVFGGALLTGGGLTLIAGSTGAAIAAPVAVVGTAVGTVAVLEGAALLAIELNNLVNGPANQSQNLTPNAPITQTANACYSH